MDYHTYVGCVALTMANILYYYRYPEHGYGTVLYIPKEYDDDGTLLYTYPIQSVNYSQATYDYDAIANQLDAYDGELAKLLYHCGISVHMAYGHDGSGTQSAYALDALHDHFYFANGAQFLSVSDMSSEDWIETAKGELDAKRPLFFSGRSSSAGGHAWIVDGYTTVDSITYFHVNWGWSGSDNGFYQINKMMSSGYGNFNVEGSNTMMTSLMPDSAAIEKPAVSEKRVTASFGTISDGAGNMKYAPNSNRKWVLACPDAADYRLQFSKLKVKPGDKVTIYNGGTVGTGIREEYSGDYLMAACNDYNHIGGEGVHGDYTGQNLPAAITIDADSVLVVFTSTANSETDYGFVLDYKVTNFHRDACVDATYTDGYAVLTDKPSNSTEETYRASNVCEYTLDLRFTDRLVCAFKKFDLQQGDFVDIYNQETRYSSSLVQLAHFDASNPPTQVYTFDVPVFIMPGGQGHRDTLSRFIIRFGSDNKDQGTGFEFEYYALNTGNSISQFDNTEVHVYPNPATSFVNVEVTAEQAQTFSAKVVDMMGKTIYAEQIGHNGGSQIYQIPVENLAKGVYFLHLNSTSGSYVQKLVVE